MASKTFPTQSDSLSSSPSLLSGNSQASQASPRERHLGLQGAWPAKHPTPEPAVLTAARFAPAPAVSPSADVVLHTGYFVELGVDPSVTLSRPGVAERLGRDAAGTKRSLNALAKSAGYLLAVVTGDAKTVSDAKASCLFTEYRVAAYDAVAGGGCLFSGAQHLRVLVPLHGHAPRSDVAGRYIALPLAGAVCDVDRSGLPMRPAAVTMTLASACEGVVIWTPPRAVPGDDRYVISVLHEFPHSHAAAVPTSQEAPPPELRKRVPLSFAFPRSQPSTSSSSSSASRLASSASSAGSPLPAGGSPRLLVPDSSPVAPLDLLVEQVAPHPAVPAVPAVVPRPIKGLPARSAASAARSAGQSSSSSASTSSLHEAVPVKTTTPMQVDPEITAPSLTPVYSARSESRRRIDQLARFAQQPLLVIDEAIEQMRATREDAGPFALLAVVERACRDTGYGSKAGLSEDDPKLSKAEYSIRSDAWYDWKRYSDVHVAKKFPSGPASLEAAKNDVVVFLNCSWKKGQRIVANPSMPLFHVEYDAEDDVTPVRLRVEDPTLDLSHYSAALIPLVKALSESRQGWLHQELSAMDF